jgi:hypothetical protein
LRFDAQEKHIVWGEVDLFGTSHGGHRQGVGLLVGDQLQTLLADAVDVRRPTDDQRIVPGAVKVSANATADRAGTKDYKAHRSS